MLRLPHRLTLITTTGTVVLLLAAGAPGTLWRTTTLSALVLAGGYAIIRVVSRGGLGLGDVAVAAPIGLMLGWHDWRLVITTALLGHTAAVAAIPVRRLTGYTRTPIPLGTYLIATSITTLTAAGLR